MDVHLVPCLKDNYAFIIHDPQSGVTALVDTPEFKPIKDFLDVHEFKLDLILNTHHHPDHVGANLELKDLYDCQIVGPEYDKERIPGIDHCVLDGESIEVGSYQADTLFLPGHTSGIIAYHFKSEKMIFVADVLFSIGCGYLFEGTPEQMWNSLKRLRELPDETEVFCAHEYTENNIRFALTIDPDNSDLKDYAEYVSEVRESRRPTIPTRIDLEKKANPFLRADVDPILTRFGKGDALVAFKTIRDLKNNF